MFQLHQERDGFIRFADERNYWFGEDVQCCGNSGFLQMWFRFHLHSLGHCDVIYAAMGWGQATISLDGCVHVVRFFNRASLTRFLYILDTYLSFRVSILRISLLWNPFLPFAVIFMVHLWHLDAVTELTRIISVGPEPEPEMR
jgi:hypothetical protein